MCGSPKSFGQSILVGSLIDIELGASQLVGLEDGREGPNQNILKKAASLILSFILSSTELGPLEDGHYHGGCCQTACMEHLEERGTATPPGEGRRSFRRWDAMLEHLSHLCLVSFASRVGRGGKIATMG